MKAHMTSKIRIKKMKFHILIVLCGKLGTLYSKSFVEALEEMHAIFMHTKIVNFQQLFFFYKNIGLAVRIYVQ
jgi:hypothetical protein